MPLVPGISGSATLDVTPEHTAPALGSGDLPVLGTPALIALCEAATLEAVAGHLAQDSTSVGSHIDIQHLSPTPVGASVVARAELTVVDGVRLSFDVEANCDDTRIGHGRIERVIVEREPFLRRMTST